MKKQKRKEEESNARWKGKNISKGADEANESRKQERTIRIKGERKIKYTGRRGEEGRV